MLLGGRGAEGKGSEGFGRVGVMVAHLVVAHLVVAHLSVVPGKAHLSAPLCSRLLRNSLESIFLPYSIVHASAGNVAEKAGGCRALG